MKEPILSVITANYIAEHVGYDLKDGWIKGYEAMSSYFRPLESFRDRFAVLVRRIRQTGFRNMDLYLGHLNPSWATSGHITAALEVLHEEEMTLTSLCGYFGGSLEEFRQCCLLAQSLGAPLLSGSTPLLRENPAELIKLLEAYDLRLGLENHPEKNADEHRAWLPAEPDDSIGLTVDTGWYATQGADVLKELQAVRQHLMHVHLKDIRQPVPGSQSGYELRDKGHETCPLGEGIVPVAACLDYLMESGFPGPVSFEHEPEREDPTEATREAYRYLSRKIR